MMRRTDFDGVTAANGAGPRQPDQSSEAPPTSRGRNAGAKIGVAGVGRFALRRSRPRPVATSSFATGGPIRRTFGFRPGPRS